MREECHRNIHRTELFALAAVDARIRDVGETASGGTSGSGGALPRFTMSGVLFQLVGCGETDRAVLNTGIALDAPGGLFVDGLPDVCPKSSEILLPPLVAELEHCTFDLSADLKTLGVCRFGQRGHRFYCTVNEVCTLVAADLDKGCLTGLVADDTPVTAGKVCLAGDFVLAPAAVADLRP